MLAFWVMGSLWGAFLLFVAFAPAITEGESVPAWLVATGICCLGTAPAMIAFSVRTYRSKNRTVAGQHSLTLDADGIHMSNPLVDMTLQWKAVHKVIETRSFFLFFISVGIAQYLPKRVISPEDLPSVRELIASHTRAALPPG